MFNTHSKSTFEFYAMVELHILSLTNILDFGLRTILKSLKFLLKLIIFSYVSNFK